MFTAAALWVFADDIGVDGQRRVLVDVRIPQDYDLFGRSRSPELTRLLDGHFVAV
jgi:hypothetical protein